MRIVFSGQMDVVRRQAAPNSGRGSVVLNDVEGKVLEGHHGPDDNTAKLSVQLLVKPTVLATIPIGASLYVIVTDQKPEGLE